MSLYSALLRPLLFRLPAETAHHLGIAGARWTAPLRGAGRRVDDARLAQRLWDMEFANPVGLAAGLDKNGLAIAGFAACGFSHVEIGTVTGQAQPGNPRPRLFRLPADQAVINRMGFNNDGAAAIAARLGRRYGRVGDAGARRPPCVLGVNLGKSKVVDLARALDDYVASVELLAPFADYLVVNVSSPNTPGLRDLQAEAQLRPLLSGVRAAVDRTCPPSPRRRPLLLKIAPDLGDDGIDAAVDVALETGCDGLIATNTTIARGGLATPEADVRAIGAGGLSGRPLRQRANAVLARVACRVRAAPASQRVPVIGVGGIDSPAAAWERIGHGADLIQVYTALIYHGPGLAARINRGLAAELARVGLRSIGEASGRDL